MKAYTDLEQSEKLAKILPPESADMSWCNSSAKGVNYTDKYSVHTYTVKEMQECFDETFNGWDKYWKIIPCWSLAALLEVLPKGEYEDIDLCFGGYNNMIKFVPEWFCSYEQQEPVLVKVCSAQNAIDACYKLILKLHELKKI